MIAVIPARGGSKRIPRKNIRDLNGRPLLAWAIEACTRSGAFERIIVSTDNAEIADVARSHGAEVPFVRPSSLADDVAPTVDVIAHAVEWLLADGHHFDLACCVYPASVLLPDSDLLNARELLEAHPEVGYAATVVPYPYPVQRALRLSNDRVSFVQPRYADSRTQDLEPLWHDAGQFYWGRREAWLEGRPILPNAVGYPVDPNRAVDIDTEDDWIRAEFLHRLLTSD
jgi:N-acylneuraminate cytidylyltransferase